MCMGRIENYLYLIFTKLYAKSVVSSRDCKEKLLSCQFFITFLIERRMKMLLLCSLSDTLLLLIELSSKIIVSLLLSRPLSYIYGLSLLLNTFKASWRHFFLLSTINFYSYSVNVYALSYLSLLLTIFKLANMAVSWESGTKNVTRARAGFYSNLIDLLIFFSQPSKSSIS